MHLRHLGYVGQNHTLKRTTGRTLRLANLGPDRIRQVIAANLASLRAILDWNLRHGIHFFRIASSLIPFASHERFPIDWRREFAGELAEIRAFAAGFGMRLTTHPGQYTVLNSPHEHVVANAVAELEYHAALLERLDPDAGTMTLHVGGAFGDRERALHRFVAGAERLSPVARRRVAVENDDRLFDADDALWAARAIGAPMVFDVFHHRCLHRRASWDEALPELLETAVATWGERVPKLHLSSARTPGSTRHADHVAPEDLQALTDAMGRLSSGRLYDLMVEAKAKERAVLRLRAGA